MQSRSCHNNERFVSRASDKLVQIYSCYSVVIYQIVLSVILTAVNSLVFTFVPQSIHQLLKSNAYLQIEAILIMIICTVILSLTLC